MNINLKQDDILYVAFSGRCNKLVLFGRSVTGPGLDGTFGTNIGVSFNGPGTFSTNIRVNEQDIHGNTVSNPHSFQNLFNRKFFLGQSDVTLGQPSDCITMFSAVLKQGPTWLPLPHHPRICSCPGFGSATNVKRVKDPPSSSSKALEVPRNTRKQSTVFTAHA